MYVALTVMERGCVKYDLSSKEYQECKTVFALSNHSVYPPSSVVCSDGLFS